ncbi:MAG: hypothetical protein ACOH2H_22425 [Cypionkella sp.]
MAWSDLTKTQQDFLVHYLDPSFLDKLFGMGTSSSTADVIDTFEAFGLAKTAFENALAKIPDDYPERIGLAAAATEAGTSREDGDFGPGAKTLLTAKAEAEKVVSVVTAEADRLRLLPLPVVAGANEDEVKELAALHATATLNGHAGIPSHAALTAARKAEPALATRAQTVTLAVAQRLAAAKLEFTSAWDPVKETISKAAVADIDAPWTAYSKHDHLKNSKGWAVSLRDTAQKAITDDTAEAYTKAASDLTTNAAYADIQIYFDQALDEFRKDLKAQHDQLEKAVAPSRQLKDGDMNEVEKQTRKPLLATAEDLLKRTQVALNGSAAQPMVDLAAEIRTSTTSADLINFFNARLLRKDKEKFADQGVTAEATKGMEALFGSADFTTYVAVRSIIEKTSKTLGKATVTPAFLDTKRDEAAEAEKRRLAADKASKDADDAFAKALKINNESSDALKALRKQAKEATDKDEKKRLEAEVKKASLAFDPIHEEALEAQRVKKDKAKALATEKELAEKAAEILKAAEAQKGVLDAINFGPLSPDRSPKLSSQSRTEMCNLFMAEPSVGARGADALARAEDPEAVAACAKVVNQRLASGFEDDSGGGFNAAYSRKYAGRLIDMSANLPASALGGLDGYLAKGRHRVDLPEFTVSMDAGKRGQTGAKHVAAGMIDSDGDFDFDGAEDRLADLMFNADAIANAQPELVKHMLDTVEYFRGSPTAQQKIADLGEPTSPGGKALVAQSTGEDPDSLDDADTQQAVLTAMMTPVHQGNIGSCFSTASVIRLRQDFPDDALDCFIELAEQGTFRPMDGDSLPAVTNLPENDNPLVRSLEFTAATATARAENSSERKALKGTMTSGLDVVDDMLIYEESLSTLVAKVSDGFSFLYDPKAELKEKASDGSSKFGRYVLLRKDNGAPINSKPEFIAAMRDIVHDAIDEDDLAENITIDQVVDAAIADTVIEGMKRDDKYPWELDSGGRTEAAAKTILNMTGQRSEMVAEVASGTGDPKARTLAIAKSLLTSVPSGPGTSDYATIRTVGQHGFNALPNHPSLDEIRSAGPDKIGDKLDEILTGKGAELKDREIPVEQAIYMFEREMDDWAKSASGATKKAIDDAIRSLRPTTPLKPAALDALIKQATAEYVNLKIDADVESWKAGLKKDSKPDPTDEEIEKKKTARRETRERWVAEGSRNRLCKDLAVPEIVLADTNWGGGVDKTLFVVAPDPITGDPMMFKRRDPPGTLTPVDKDWLEKEWARVT